MIDIKAIKAAAEAATPGPWEFGSFHSILIIAKERDKYNPIADLGATNFPWNESADSEARYSNAIYISTANPSTVLELCNEVEKLRLKQKWIDEGEYTIKAKGVLHQQELIIMKQEKEIEKLRKDATRYQWLTDDHPNVETRRVVSAIASCVGLRGKGATDAAIDVAMEAK